VLITLSVVAAFSAVEIHRPYGDIRICSPARSRDKVEINLDAKIPKIWWLL
jgi:hypothetical protein